MTSQSHFSAISWLQTRVIQVNITSKMSKPKIKINIIEGKPPTKKKVKEKNLIFVCKVY